VTIDIAKLTNMIIIETIVKEVKKFAVIHKEIKNYVGEHFERDSNVM